MPAALVSLGLVWGGEAPAGDAPHVAAAAAESGNGCLSIQPDRSGRVIAFNTSDRSTGACVHSIAKLPLVHDAMLGSGILSSDLEFTNLDFGRLSAQEVKLKFGGSRGLVAGITATLDGSFGRVLGSLEPIFDEQLRLGLKRQLDAHWETGLEGHVASLGSIGVTQLTERTGLVFLRARYALFPWRAEDEQHVVFRLSADAWQAPGQGSGRHARADLRYEYRRDVNILSVGLNAAASDGDPGIAPIPALRVDVRATRPF